MGESCVGQRPHEPADLQGDGPRGAFVASARLVISNDTGPRHFALALGTPVVSLFGPSDHRWSTVDTPGQRVLLAQPFLNKTQVADRATELCAIDRIAVGDVLWAAGELLAANRDR